jgi:hypothetical protein
MGWLSARRFPSLSWNQAALSPIPPSDGCVCDFGDAVDGVQTGQVVVLEHQTPGSELGHRRLDVVDLPGHLRVLARWFADRGE